MRSHCCHTFVPDTRNPCRWLWKRQQLLRIIFLCCSLRILKKRCQTSVLETEREREDNQRDDHLKICDAVHLFNYFLFFFFFPFLGKSKAAFPQRYRNHSSSCFEKTSGDSLCQRKKGRYAVASNNDYYQSASSSLFYHNHYNNFTSKPCAFLYKG